MNMSEVRSRIEELSADHQALVAEAPQGGPSLEALGVRLAELLQQARASAQVAFLGPGAVGVVEALLGCAGELRSSGQLVQLEPRRAAVGRTALGNWRARVVDDHDAGALLAGLLRAGMAALDEEPGLRSELPSLREWAAKADDASSASRWQDACTWAKEVAARAHGPELRRIAFEAYRLARTHEAHRHAWAGRVQPLSPDQADRLLALGADCPADFDEIDRVAYALQAPGAPNDGALAALAPLVRRLQVDAQLPPAIAREFDIGEEGGLQFLAADGPAPQVDVVVHLIAAGRGELVQASERDLAVVSQFNRALEDEAERARLEQMASGTGPLSADEFLGQLPRSLAPLLKQARGAVLDGALGRVCLFSAPVYLLERCGTQGAPPPGRDEYLQKNVLDEGRKQALLAGLGPWYQVAGRLQAAPDDESRALGALLADYAQAGGGPRLIGMVRALVERAGNAQAARRLAGAVEREEKALEELKAKARQRRVAAPVASAPAPAVPPRQALARVASGIDDLLVRVLPRVALEFRYRRPGSGEVVNVRDRLRSWLVSEVSRWHHWVLLFGLIGKETPSGFLGPVEADEAALAASASQVEPAEPPTHSGAFQAQFLHTLREAHRRVLAEAALVAGHVLEQIKGSPLLRKNAAAWEALAKAEPPGHLDEAEKARFREAASGAADLSRLAGPALADVEARFPLRDEALLHWFPLQDASEPLHYAWSPAAQRYYRDVLNPRLRHQMFVMRLRHALVEASLQFADQQVELVRRALQEALADRLKQARDVLRRASNTVK